MQNPSYRLGGFSPGPITGHGYKNSGDNATAAVLSTGLLFLPLQDFCQRNDRCSLEDILHSLHRLRTAFDILERDDLVRDGLCLPKPTSAEFHNLGVCPPVR